MAVPYIDTPRTEVDANATYLDRGFRSAMRNDLSVLDSLEESFQSPSKDGDILKIVDNNRKRENSLKTPKGASKSRIPLNKRHLPAFGGGKGEFTPLMNSASKSNHTRNQSDSLLQTPAPSFRSRPRFSTTPGPEGITNFGDDSSDNTNVQATPLPQAAGSSVQSSPLPQPLGENGNIVGDGQVLTLREQEKAKQISKNRPEYKDIVHQENLDLKVEKVTQQNELLKLKKQLKMTNQNLLSCQQELQDSKETAKRKYADEGLKKDLEEKNARLQKLMDELEETKRGQSDKISELNEEISDLQYDLREKDRTIEEKDEEIEKLQGEFSNSNVAEELQEKLDHAKEQIEELRDMLERAKAEARDSNEAYEKASEKNEQLREHLRKAQDEIKTKSFASQGMSRQMEEKIRTLQENLESSHEDNQKYERKLLDKTRQIQDMEERLQQNEYALEAEKRQLEGNLNSITRKYEALKREKDDLSLRMHNIDNEIDDRDDAENILKSRHDALMAESAGLQRDLREAKSTIAKLEELVETERQQFATDAEDLRVQYNDKINRLNDQLNAVQHELEDKIGQHAADTDKWESMKRLLEIQKDKAEHQAASYKRTIDKLQAAETTLSSKEQKLQNIIESERQRHKDEDLLLNRQIKELNDDIVERRKTAETQRAELLKVKEELRVSKREENAMREKVQTLEDEIVVLQANLEEQQNYAKAHATTESSTIHQQLQAATKEKRVMQAKLSDAQVEAADLKSAKAEVEAERDELRDRLKRLRELDGTSSHLDEEKAQLQRVKTRLEAELNRMREERISLIEARNGVQDELDREFERAAAEEARLTSRIDDLENELRVMGEKRDRALTSAKTKAEHLQKRVEELEDLLARQESTTEAPSALTSPGSQVLRRHLDEARLKEKALVRREHDLKASLKELKKLVADLERENHEFKTKELSAPSPKTPSSALQEEVRALRKQVLDSQKLAKDLRKQRKELEAMKVKEEEREDLHELLKSSTLEAESLALKLSERDARVQELRSHLRRVRDERTALSRQLEKVQDSAEVLEQQYQDAVDELQNQGDRKGKHAKELKGLGKEIIWLRAKFLRERKFREDLAWSKGLMELGERVRAACNATDLQMIAEMGVRIPKAEKQRNARRKFKAAAWAIVAMSRMKRLSADWRDARVVGDGLRRAKQDVVKKREGTRRRKGL
ncbi:Vacuolar protein sorting-associated protein 4 [Ascosphaera pollenicola]|nr:Vacuolar protein sorting-associated protein 4 [Ascosphaera pollenicola]